MESQITIGSRELQQIADFKLRGRGVGNTTLVIENILALIRMDLDSQVFVICELQNQTNTISEHLLSVFKSHDLKFEISKQRNFVILRVRKLRILITTNAIDINRIGGIRVEANAITMMIRLI